MTEKHPIEKLPVKEQSDLNPNENGHDGLSGSRQAAYGSKDAMPKPVGEIASQPAEIQGGKVLNDVLYINALTSDLVKTGGLSPQNAADDIQYLSTTPQALLDGRPSILPHDTSAGGAFAQESRLTGQDSPVVNQVGVDVHLNNFGVMKDASGAENFLFTDVDKASPNLRNEVDLEKTAVSILQHGHNLSPEKQQQLIKDFTTSYLTEIRRLAASGERPSAALTADDATGAIKDIMTATDTNTVAQPSLPPSDSTNEVSPQTKSDIAKSLGDYVKQPGMIGRVADPPQIVGIVQEKSTGGSSFGMTNYKALAPAQPGGANVEVELKEILPAPGGSDPGNMHTADAANVVKNAKYFDGDNSPILGSAEINGHSYLVRPTDDGSPAVAFKNMSGFANKESYVQNVGVVMARMHARSPGGANAIADWAAGNDTKIATNLTQFAVDYENHLQAVTAGLSEQNTPTSNDPG